MDMTLVGVSSPFQQHQKTPKQVHPGGQDELVATTISQAQTELRQARLRGL